MEFAAMTGMLLNIGIMLLFFLLIGGLGFGIYMLYKRWIRFQQFKVVIWRKIGQEPLTEKYDMAGIFVDKTTGDKKLYLKQNVVGLKADDIPFIIAGKGKKVIYLLQTGLKNFHFIKLAVKYPTITLSTGEEDVNWGVGSYEKAKKRFTQDILMQYLPYISLAIVSIIILVIFIYFFKQFPVLKDVAINLKEAAEAIAHAKAGTVVIN